MAEPAPIRWIGASEKGPVRHSNEDAFEIVSEAGVAVVADGVGGGPGGARASRLAAEATASVLADAPWPDHDGDTRRLAVRRAHEAVAARWRDEPALRGMATTLTAIRWRGNRVEGVHVGDSRAYRLSPEGLEALTRDHTPAGVQLAMSGGDRGVLRTHPRRHLLLRVVGGEEEGPDPDLFELAADVPSTVLVLCSDGVDAALPEVRFEELLAPALAGDLEGALEGVVAEVLRAGAPDNVTLVLAARGAPSPAIP